jgi:carboxymethylenebutenolidase
MMREVTAGHGRTVTLAGACPVVGSYGGKNPEASHGFINDHDPADQTLLLVVLDKVFGTRYHEPSARDAHQRIAAFFGRHLAHRWRQPGYRSCRR